MRLEMDASGHTPILQSPTSKSYERLCG
jgi:hypothetical protein